jgi:IS30 family transposase
MADARLHAWVADALTRGWTPGLVEGRLKLEYPDDPGMRVSHECLYQWIYRGRDGDGTDWRRYLPRAKRHRTKRSGRKAQRVMIPMRVPLALRPKAVDSRGSFGHFESDTVIGSAPSRTCIDTQVERKTRRLFARLIADKRAPETARAEYAVYSAIPPAARIDRTWDNGTESSLHRLVDEALGMLTYYADPYSPWQRGSNENRNGRIRRYLPKRTSLKHLTQEDLDDIVQEINDTPMKLLGYHTPNEAWQEELGKLQLQSQPAKGVRWETWTLIGRAGWCRSILRSSANRCALSCARGIRLRRRAGSSPARPWRRCTCGWGIGRNGRFASPRRA